VENAELRRQLVAKRAKPKLVDHDAPPEIAETIVNTERLKGPVRNFERKFLRDIRTIMDGHAAQTMKQYLAWLERRRYVLLKEKLRRLKLAQQEADLKEGSNV
jgi:hypothetical protein